MNDIVERLRKENSHPTLYGVPKIQADAADEIEGLRKTVDAWRSIYVDAVTALEADNERLRAALAKIAKYEIEEGCPCNACEHSQIAHAALETPKASAAENKP